MIKPGDDIYIEDKQSCTKDEAAAKLIGWMQGSIRLRFIYLDKDGNISPDQLKTLHTLEFPLKDYLQEQRDTANKEYRDAKQRKASRKVIREKENAVLEIHELIEKAVSYLVDINDEIAKGESSELRIDQIETAKTGVMHLTLRSVDQWARSKYGISIVGSASTKTSTENEPAELQVGQYGGKELVEGKEKTAKPRMKMLEQAKCLLNAIAGLGYDPKCLPKNVAGKPGVKSRVRDSLKGNILFAGNTVFDRTWEQIAKSKDIAYKK